MKKIGITGSLASGKTTASKILSFRNGPLFSADEIVRKLYNQVKFKNILKKKFKIKNNSDIKNILRKKILINKTNLTKLEKMQKFIKKNKNNKLTFFEIPLLVESKLMNKFDIIVFIQAKKSNRLKRFKAKGGNKNLFNLLNNKQLSDKKKIKFCDHVVVNDKNIKFLKKALSDILTKYV